MTKFAIALKKVLNEYDIPRCDIEELTGFPHVSIHNWISGRCEPAADVPPKLANALDLLCVDGGKMLLSEYFGRDFGSAIQRPAPVNVALHTVLDSYTFKAAQLARLMRKTDRDLYQWSSGRRVPRAFVLGLMADECDRLRLGAGQLLMSQVFGRYAGVRMVAAGFVCSA